MAEQRPDGVERGPGVVRGRARGEGPGPGGKRKEPFRKPPLRLLATTLWEYPSQHYGDTVQGDKRYVGATPSWVIWQLLQRYTRENDLVVDPMCGSGTTIDVCADLGRRSAGFDLSPSRPDIARADARSLPLADASADFLFVDPPYSTHVEYSDKAEDIGRLDAADPAGGYYAAMERVIGEAHRVLKDRRYMALYVSDSWKKRAKGSPLPSFMPIGFELFALLRRRFKPVDIVVVVRKNAKLNKANWRKAAEEGNFFLRGFNYLFIMKKEEGERGGR